MKQTILRLIQGALIGAGAILPGVSGGMLCLMFGVYEPVMSLLSRPVSTFREQRRLFVPLFWGGVLGFLLLASGMEWAFDRDSAAAICLFLGLVAGSLPPLIEETGGMSRRSFLAAFAGTLALMQLFRHSALTVQPNALWFLFCGAIWGLSLVLPGLSSSTILIFLGLYQPIAVGIAALDLTCILPVGAGAALSALTAAPPIRRALERHRSVLMSIILGTVCASSVMILPLEYRSAQHVLLCVLYAATGFSIALILELTGVDIPTGSSYNKS